MYIAVCDDKKEELDMILPLISSWQKENNVFFNCKAFHSAAELLHRAEKEKFTLYLLDVMMPGIDGLDAAREIRRFDETADIVFLTASPGFAYESYGVRALDYLLKPVSRELLFPMLDRVYQKEQKIYEALTLKTGTTIMRIPFAQLSYVEVIGKKLYFNLTDGTVREVVGSLKTYEPLLLARPEFMRIHRSYIVNMLQTEKFSSTELITFQGHNLPVSRLLYPQLQKDYMKLLFEDRSE